MGNKQKILVIIPAYNEEGSVGKVVHLFFYPVRNLTPLLPPGQAPPRKGSCPGQS